MTNQPQDGGLWPSIPQQRTAAPSTRRWPTAPQRGGGAEAEAARREFLAAAAAVTGALSAETTPDSPAVLRALRALDYQYGTGEDQ